MIGSKLLPTLTKEDLRRRISDPHDELGIRKGDLLTFLGTEDEVDAYLQKLFKEDLIEEDEAASITLDEYLAGEDSKVDASCFSFTVGPAAEFRGRSIASVDLRGSYGSLVVAIEHNALIKIKPSRNTRFSAGDRVWVLADDALSRPLVEKIDEIEADATLRETLSAALPLSRA